MSWTGLPDSAERCGADPGPVQDAEDVAQLRHEKNSLPFIEPFRSDKLLAPKGAFDDNCGNSDGLSLTRVSGLTDEEINDMAKALAGPDRASAGAVVANVAALRSFRLADNDDQVLFIYDDPVRGVQPAHAIVRAAEWVKRPAIALIRNALHAAFSRQVEP